MFQQSKALYNYATTSVTTAGNESINESAGRTGHLIKRYKIRYKRGSRDLNPLFLSQVVR